MPRSGLTTALVAVLMGGGAHAASPSEPLGRDDTCRRAAEALGAGAVDDGMTEAQCQQALDNAEEERWQLWLDSAAADELTGSHERAALTLDRLVEDIERRTSRLPAQWVVVRDEARATMARLDATILMTKARVTLVTTPHAAEATVAPGVAASLPERLPLTPLTAYFAPGTHRVRLLHRETDSAREVSFTVTAGRTIVLHVDLTRAVPPELAVIEGPGEPVLGGRAVVEAEAPIHADGPNGLPDGPVTLDDSVASEPGDAPPIRRSGTSFVATLGTASIAAGTASLAVGAVFALIGAGLDDEAACSGAACDQHDKLRAQVRRDADVSWARATGTFIVGGMFVAGGVIALLLDGDDEPSTSLRPWLGPDGGGLGGAVRF